MLAVPRAADRSSRSAQGTADHNEQAAASALGSVHIDRPVHRNTRRCDCFSVAVPSGRPLVHRSRPGYLLPIGNRPPRDQQAADAGADTAPVVGSYAVVGAARHRDVAFRGVARRAGQVGEDWLQACRELGRPMGQGHAAYAAAHGGDVADAARRADLAGRRLSRHVGRDDRADLWPSIGSSAIPPCFPAVLIDGEYYWVGGVYSNSPIEVAFDECPRESSVVFAVQIWHTQGPRPESLSHVFMREKDILFGSRSRTHIMRQAHLHRMRRIIRELVRTWGFDFKGRPFRFL